MSNTRELVEKYQFRFTKSLGQNFLVDQNIVRDIVKGAEVSKEDYVIEIGPGVGTLTRELLKEAASVTAIELDDKLLPILKEELKDHILRITLKQNNQKSTLNPLYNKVYLFQSLVLHIRLIVLLNL